VVISNRFLTLKVAGQHMDEDYDDSGHQIVSELEDVHSTLNEILSTLKSRFDFPQWAWVLAIIFFLEGWPGSKLDRWTDKVWYSSSRNADFKNIRVEKRPSDCDFFHAQIAVDGMTLATFLV
jgi:hypothetical protein